CREELAVLGRDTAQLERVQKPFPRITYSAAVELLRSDETAEMLATRMEGVRSEEQELRDELAENQRRYGQAKQWEKERTEAREIEIGKRIQDVEEQLRNLAAWAESARAFEWGNDFGGSDGTALTWHFDRPIIVHRYPAEVKAFYMKRDPEDDRLALGDRKSTRLNSSHVKISYAVFCLK